MRRQQPICIIYHTKSRHFLQDAHIFNCIALYISHGGEAMKDPAIILTEQHPPKDPLFTSPLIRQAVTAWLTKELFK